MNDLISRQAAIDALGERPMVWTDDDQYALGERNQYDRDRLAIETLPSAEPNLQPTCNQLATDCISRQAAIHALDDEITITGKSNAYVAMDYVKRVRRKLDDLPSAQPERKKGRWIKNADENCWWYECSECGDYPMKNAYGHEELSAYCPHCGAIMEGEEDDE